MFTRYADVRLRLVDILSLGWMTALIPLFLWYRADTPQWPVFLTVHIVYVVAGLELIRATARNSANRWVVALRLLFPSIIFVYGFIEVGKLANAMSPDPWFADFLVRWDLELFGVHPTVWVKRFYSPWLDELMAVFRVAFYVAPVAIFGALVVKDKREATLDAGAILIATCIVNYLCFIALPALSPRMIPDIASLDTTEYTGFVFGWIEHAIQGDKGTVVGNAFPSAHVSGTVACTIVAYRHLPRWTGHVMAVFSVGMAVSAVYFGFHHALDPVAGFVVPFLVYPLVRVATRLVDGRRTSPSFAT